MTKFLPVLPVDAGCWIDGHHGVYGPERLVSIAESYGYESTLLHGYELLEPEDWEAWIWESEAAAEWMNDHVAPEGFSFGWFDGEWFLWSQESWEDAY